MKVKKFIFFATSVLLISGGVAVVDETGIISSTKVYAANSRTVTVEPTDFLNYFQRNGSAANFDYDTATYTQTLTPNQKSQAGNVTLKNKIDMSQDFSFTGLLNLGDKSKAQGGADGIGILFHPGNTDVVGNPGGAAGIGGVKGAFGFKLDTYYNGWNDTSFAADPSQFSNGQSFGAFVNSLTGQAQTITNSAQAISQPSGNTFLPFTMTYNGSTKVMTVTYDGKSWSQDVSQLVGNNKAMSFSISASTGASINLQQLRNIEFTYTMAQGNVSANYIDELGNKIADTVTTSGDLNTLYATEQKNINGYTLKNTSGAATSGLYTADDQIVNYVYTRNQGTADVTYTDDTTGKTLTTKSLSGNTGDKAGYSTADTIKNYEIQGYELVSDNYPTDDVTYKDDPQHYQVHLKHKSTPVTPDNPQTPGTPINPDNPDGPKWPDGSDKGSLTKTVTETIHYVYKDGSKASDDVVDTVTFDKSIIVDNVTGEIIKNNDWQAQDNKTSFTQKNSPAISGYTPDQSKIDALTGLTPTSEDVTYTVVYDKYVAPLTPIVPVKPKIPTTPNIFSPVDKTPLNTSSPTSKINNNNRILPNTGSEFENNYKSLGVLAVILGMISSLVLLLKRKNK